MISLLTDFGLEDEYVGVMKGVILRVNPSAVIVDLCHSIPPGDLPRAARVLAWSWGYFPKGTIHVVVVDPGVGSSRKILCAEYSDHLFLAPDNGVLSWVLPKSRKARVRRVNAERYFLPRISGTFHGRDIFGPVAGHLSKDLSPDRLGPLLHSYVRLEKADDATRESTRLVGRIVDRDRFGNALTNIRVEQMEAMGSRSRLQVSVGKRVVGGIASSYAVAGPGGPLAIVGSRGLLEIAVCQGSAFQKLRLRVGDRVECRLR